MKHRPRPEASASTDSNVTISRIDLTQNTLPPVASPPLRQDVTEARCREFFIENYCRQGVRTFDGIDVRFPTGTFKHAFFESPAKVQFSMSRATRVHWIAHLLADRNAILLQGFDKKAGIYSPQRRVAIWPTEAYLTIIQLDQTCAARAYFITAFHLCCGTADKTLTKLLSSPLWGA